VLLERFDEETPEAKLRFEAEIDALRMLRHPNIVRLNGFGQEDDLLYYVMELVCGMSLHKELKKQRGFLWQDVAKIGYEVCLALKHGHDRGITHRDLKPANIMLDNSGVVKIADYGIAHCFGNHRLTGSNAVIGTIEFMSPEQAVAGPVGPKSDLYSLGAVLYTLLCRQPPFVAKTLPDIIKMHLHEPLEDIAHFRHDVPAELIRIIRHMLERKPDDRPNNAFLVAKRFGELLISEFGSTDSVIVLPSKFDESSPAPAPSDTRTAFLGNSKNEDVKNGSSLSFQLQYDISPDENVAAEDQPQDGANSKDSGADQESGNAEPSQSFSIYHDLTALSSTPGGFSGSMTRQTSAFDHLKEEDDPDSQQESLHDSPPVDTREAHESTSALGYSQTVSSFRPDGTRYVSQFTAISEEELGYQFGESEKRPYISVQVAVLSLCLVILGLWAWWMLQPPSAEKLYASITRHVNPDRLPPRQSAILAAESDIKRFLELYPKDDRADTVLNLQKEVELAQMERSLDRYSGTAATDKKLFLAQRSYLEAVSLINTNPDEAIRRLEALITLYEFQRFIDPDDSDEVVNPEPPEQGQERDLSNPVSIMVEIARRRLATLQEDIAPVIETQIEQLESMVERIQRMETIDPDKADAMRKAARKLYSDKPWAAEILKERSEGRGTRGEGLETRGEGREARD